MTEAAREDSRAVAAGLAVERAVAMGAAAEEVMAAAEMAVCSEAGVRGGALPAVEASAAVAVAVAVTMVGGEGTRSLAQTAAAVTAPQLYLRAVWMRSGHSPRNRFGS